MADTYRHIPYYGDIFPGQDIKLSRDAEKALAEANCFSLVDSDLVLSTITFAEALSHFR
jgi:hypothetical protein